VESFEAELDLPFLNTIARQTDGELSSTAVEEFRSVFIRAPVVEKILPRTTGIQADEEKRDETVVAPSLVPKDEVKEFLEEKVEVMARLPGRAKSLENQGVLAEDVGEDGDIIAVRQGNCFGTSFHPELTGDARIHVWWLNEVVETIRKRKV
jgi:5'-phosphate synthase pdxT subunit